jgi:hypothetical protein
MKFEEFSVSVKPKASPEIHKIPVDALPDTVTKKKQAKWIPPLQQMLDLLKKSVNGQDNILATANDPTMGRTVEYAISESTTADEMTICNECGHLNLPRSIAESNSSKRIQEKWDKLSSKVTGGIQKCNKH